MERLNDLPKVNRVKKNGIARSGSVTGFGFCIFNNNSTFLPKYRVPVLRAPTISSHCDMSSCNTDLKNVEVYMS